MGSRFSASAMGDQLLMNTVQDYWRQVREKRQELQASERESFFLISLSMPARSIKAGVVVECDTENASRRLVEGTHRIATDDEIRAYEQLQARNLERTNKIELRRASGTGVLNALHKLVMPSEDVARHSGRAKP